MHQSNDKCKSSVEISSGGNKLKVYAALHLLIMMISEMYDYMDVHDAQPHNVSGGYCRQTCVLLPLSFSGNLTNQSHIGLMNLLLEAGV